MLDPEALAIVHTYRPRSSFLAFWINKRDVLSLVSILYGFSLFKIWPSFCHWMLVAELPPQEHVKTKSWFSFNVSDKFKCSAKNGGKSSFS